MQAAALLGRIAALTALVALAACGHAPLQPGSGLWEGRRGTVDKVLSLLPADVLLLGEQHDASEHHQIEREAVETLAARGVLAAVALEMAERGRSTIGLPPDASEADARAALGWGDRLWPWPDYAAVVMAALRAGVPVVGANLPRDQMREAMEEDGLDKALSDTGLAAQRQAIRRGHCDLLPESQIAPMTRVQVARDRSMARAIEGAVVPGQTVLLIAGAGHVRRDLGVPLHLDPKLRSKVLIASARPSAGASSPPAVAAWDRSAADQFLLTPALPAKDHCANVR